MPAAAEGCPAPLCGVRREEVAYSRAPMQPPVRPRTFLVANIVDPTQRLFVSKSILDDALPPVLPLPLLSCVNLFGLIALLCSALPPAPSPPLCSGINALSCVCARPPQLACFA